MKEIIAVLLAVAGFALAETATIVTPPAEPPPPTVQSVPVPDALKAGFLSWVDSLVPPSPTRSVTVIITSTMTNSNTRIVVNHL